MTIQESILSLHKQQKITKADVYQLISKLPKSAPAEQSAEDTPKQQQAQVVLETDSVTDVMTLWLYFIHIITNLDRLQLEFTQDGKVHNLQVGVGTDCSFNELKAYVEEQLGLESQQLNDADPIFALSDASLSINDYAASAKLTTNELQSKLELNTSPEGRGATNVDDWADVISLLWQQIRANPEQQLAELEHLTTKQKMLLEEYNRTHIYLPENKTFAGVLQPVLQELAAETAVITSEQQMNYEQLNVHSSQLAHLLRSLGARPNKLIPVIVERDHRMPSVLTGVIYSGGAYVPLEPSNPQDRTRSIIQETQADTVVVDAKTLSSGALDLSDSQVKSVVCIDSWPEKRYQGVKVFDQSKISRQKKVFIDNINSPDDICYVIFTSGSTGKPKGVVISHLNLINTLIGVNSQFNVNSTDKVMCFSSYSFDLSVWDMFGAFLAGASVFVPTKAEIKEPKRLMDIIQDHGITIWDSVPTGMSQLLLPFLTEGTDIKIDTLRLVMLSGEFIPLSLPGNIHKMFPQAKISSLGGATEGTVWSIFYYPIEEVKPHWKSIPYGRPLGNQRFYVLNEKMQPCAIGQKGMLHIAGYGVAQGYYKNPDLSNAAFLKNTISDDMGPSLYRTGDLGLMNADGVIEILGRADFQVKIRGFRVELGEVETILSGLADIDQAAVLAKKEENSTKLQAFYTSNQGEIAADKIRELLAEKIPEYMIPSQFIWLEQPPVGVTGKLDRKALANFKASRADLSQVYVAADSAVEKQIAEELKSILNIDSVGVEDDFFLIGGDSLLSLQYVSVLKKVGFKATPVHIQLGRTIRAILKLINEQEEQGNSDKVETEFNLSPMGAKFIQRQKVLNRDHNNQSLVLKLGSNPDIPALTKAINRVVAHHDLLRGGLKADSDSRLHFEPAHNFKLNQVDLSGVNIFAKSGRYKEAIRQLQSSMKVDAAEITNQVLIKYSKNDYRLIWAANHLVVDSYCWRVIAEDLATAYQNPQEPLPQSEPFANYMKIVEANYEASAQQHLAEWEEQAVNDRFELPVYAPDSSNSISDLAVQSLRFSKKDTARLQQPIKAGNGINLHLLLLTTLLISLSKWSQNNKPAVDIISNGRDLDRDKDFSRTIGWFATHNPFGVTLAEDNHKCLEIVRNAWVTHQQSAQYFVEGCNRNHLNKNSGLHNYSDNAVLYNFLGSFNNLPLADDWQVLGSAGQDQAPENKRSHQLEFEAMIIDGQLSINLLYSSSMYKKSVMRSLSKSIKTELFSF